jgi:hypothetical protein
MFLRRARSGVKIVAAANRKPGREGERARICGVRSLDSRKAGAAALRRNLCRYDVRICSRRSTKDSTTACVSLGYHTSIMRVSPRYRVRISRHVVVVSVSAEDVNTMRGGRRAVDRLLSDTLLCIT